ncbi:MAG: DUF3325 family protein [Pseudomonadota bacterium]
MNTLLLFGAFLSSLFGTLALALCQRRHQRSNDLSFAPRTKRILKVIAAVTLGAAYLCLHLRDGLGFAVIGWPLLFAVSAVAVALLLAFPGPLLTVLLKPFSALSSKVLDLKPGQAETSLGSLSRE